MSMTAAERTARLEDYYHQIKTVILRRQNPVSGLLPASTAITTHGNYTDAWVRDNVYSILAVWGLALAYRKVDDRPDRTYELEHSVIKLMRGLLFAMMRQADKVERFKKSQHPLDALHAKYDTTTGDTVVGDHEWGHLQLDATSIYLLMLAQMTASGLQIIYTLDEVCFIQNLVYYIGRAYRIPDYGIWERGNKINHGNPELNASSIGMAKAALEAMDGLNLFGVDGSQESAINILHDEVARSRITLKSILPRESGSKEVDASLLSVISFPAFAVEEQELIDRTRNKIIEKLQGNYGCKRFLRDGHQTVLEDSERLHYEPHELKKFENIESEWPLFFTYLLLDGLFTGDRDRVNEYLGRLESLLVERDGFKLLPELYYVPPESIEAERENPRSQPRKPNENIPLVWAQSLYYLGTLIHEGLLDIGDIDPLGRHLCVRRHRDPIVQISLLAEDEDLQRELANRGIVTHTPKQVEPIQIRHARELSQIYTQIGRSEKLGLSGRFVKRLWSLSTSRIFHILGETVVFLPAFLDQQEFYLTLDYHFLVSQMKSELAYIQRNWNQIGRPTMTLLLTWTMLETGQEALLNLIDELKTGTCNGVRVKLGSLKQLMPKAGTEWMNFLPDVAFTESAVTETPSQTFYLIHKPDRNSPLSATQEFRLERETDSESVLQELKKAENIYEQIELLRSLIHLEGLDFDTGFGGSQQCVTVRDLVNEVYLKAEQGFRSKTDLMQYIEMYGMPPKIEWAVVREAAGLLGKVDIGLSDAVTEILVRGKQITVGKAYSEQSVIAQPMPAKEIVQKIDEFCGEDIRDRVLTQEILIYLGWLIRSEPVLFKGLLVLRVNYLILLLTSELAAELKVTQDEGYEQLMHLTPFEIKNRLRQVLASYEKMNQLLKKREALHVRQSQAEIDWEIAPEKEGDITPLGGWRRQRQMSGATGRIPKDFYPNVWAVLSHCKGLVIGDKLERRNRLDSDPIVSEMTPGEKNFALTVEHLLNKIEAPEYRQMNVEALMELNAIVSRNPELQVEDYIVLDVLIGYAVRLGWLERYPERSDRYDEDKAKAWHNFYESSPYVCAGYIVKAFRFLMESGQEEHVA